MKKNTKKMVALIVAVLLCIAMMVVPAAAAVITAVFTPERDATVQSDDVFQMEAIQEDRISCVQQIN